MFPSHASYNLARCSGQPFATFIAIAKPFAGHLLFYQAFGFFRHFGQKVIKLFVAFHFSSSFVMLSSFRSISHNAKTMRTRHAPISVFMSILLFADNDANLITIPTLLTIEKRKIHFINLKSVHKMNVSSPLSFKLSDSLFHCILHYIFPFEPSSFFHAFLE